MLRQCRVASAVAPCSGEIEAPAMGRHSLFLPQITDPPEGSVSETGGP